MAADSSVFANAIFDVGGRNAQPPVRSLMVRKQKNAHDLAIVRLRGVSRDNSSVYTTGSPVLLEWGRRNSSGQQKTLTGYVVDPEPHYDHQNPVGEYQTTDILVLGASMVLKQPFTYTWLNTPIATIVLQIAKSVRFSTDLDSDSIGAAANLNTLWPTLTSNGMSGWQVLRTLANRLGFFVYVDNTQLHFLDPMNLIRRKKGVSPFFNTVDKGNPVTLLNFEAQIGEMLPIDGQYKANRFLYGVDATTGQMIEAADLDNDVAGEIATEALGTTVTRPIIDKLETDLIADNASWAHTQLDGALRRNRFSIRAQAKLNGDTRVDPATSVILKGLGPKHSGLWAVESVEHHVHASMYNLNVELGRDSYGDVGSLPTAAGGQQVVRDRFDPFDNVLSTPIPPTILANGVWRSAWNAAPGVAGVV